jgi:predicted DNA-binding transcriptional regulator YafY
METKSSKIEPPEFTLGMKDNSLVKNKDLTPVLVRAIEASPNGLTVAEIAKREEIGIRTIYRDLEALQAAGLPLYTERVDGANRWAFVDTFKFKIPPPFNLTELMSLYVYRDIARGLKRAAFLDWLESIFKKVQSTLPPQVLVYFELIQSVSHLEIKPYKYYGQFRGYGFNGSAH